jgi:phosphatidylserine/phosphatidylglycerophosphate/cardiolipin synthase-like enzyme
VFCLILISPFLAFSDQVKSTGTVAVYFSPHGGATEAIVDEINKAESAICVQAYSFTSKEIATALVDAKDRGVSITAVFDKSQKNPKSTEADTLDAAGIPVFIDDQHSIAHNKIIIIDGKVLITGSFNFTEIGRASCRERVS